jgi:hypothetical protein
MENADVFYTADEMQGFHWIRENASQADIILTTLQEDGNGSGGKVVAQTGNRVFIGHWIETANFLEKIDQLEQFYDVQTEGEWRIAFLQEVGADYIWYDKYAREFGGWKPSTVVYLEVVFDSPTVTIFQVNI